VPAARPFTLMAFSVAFSVSALFAFQAAFRPFPGTEDDPVPAPSDAYEKTEWAFRRLTRIHTRSSKQVVDLNSDAVEVGHWSLTGAECAKMREYGEWKVFMESIQRVFPDRPIVEVDNQDAIFHVLYDLGDGIQVPGRAIYDDTGRVTSAPSRAITSFSHDSLKTH
jgi:hypothetical protein